MKLIMMLAACVIAAAAVMPDLAQLKQMNARYAPVTLKYDASRLSAGDRKALAKLVEAARILNLVFMDQLWKGLERFTKTAKRQDAAGARACCITSG